MPTPKIKVIRVTKDVSDEREAEREWDREFAHGNYYPYILSLGPRRYCICRFPETAGDLAWMDSLERQAILNKRLSSGCIAIEVDSSKVWAPT